MKNNVRSLAHSARWWLAAAACALSLAPPVGAQQVSGAGGWSAAANAAGDNTYQGFIDRPGGGENIPLGSLFHVSGWVVDTRFLDNPYWVPELKPLDGRDPRVRDYVLGQPAARCLLDGLEATIAPLLVEYRRQGRMELTVAWFRQNERWWRPLRNGDYWEFYKRNYRALHTT